MSGPMSGVVKKISSMLWELELTSKPELATYRGYTINSTDLDDYSEMTVLYKKTQCEEMMKKLKTVQRTTLNKDDEITLLILTHYLNCVIEGAKYESYLMPMSYYEAPDITFIVFTQPRMMYKTREDFSIYLERLGKQPQQLQVFMEVLSTGVKKGLVPYTTSVIPATLDRLQGFIESSIEKNPFYVPFLECPVDISSEQWQKVQKEGQDLIQNVINPSLLKLKEFLEKDYIPHLRTTPSLNSLPCPPDAPSRYSAMLKFHCDVDLSSQEIHDLGHKKVDGLIQQIQQLMEKFNFSGTLRQFAEFISQKEEFFFESEEEVLTYCQTYYERKLVPKIKSCFKVGAHIPLHFTKRQHKATAKAVYHAPSTESNSPGIVSVSTSRYKELRKYDIPTLMLHETEPGHHLQACYALQNTKLPEFRRNKDDRRYFEAPGRFPMNAAYTEGWGLYSEELGIELGFYPDKYSYFGFLSSNLSRSVRMVVDTGIHQLGWSREDAMEYMREHSALDDTSITIEIDRYITCPGQAVSYGIGQIEFHKLRKLAEEKLGDLFELKEFHHACLSNGQVPLNILEKLIQDYIDNTLSS